MDKKIKKEVKPPPKDVFDPLTIESKKAATVVLMLNSPEEEVLVKACEAIYKFALKGEKNKATLLELGAVEPLTRLLTHEDKIVRRNATRVFVILTSNSDVRKLLRKLDVMNSVIARLTPEEDVVIHEFASLCLANMSIEFTGKVQVYEHGALEPLIRLLRNPDPDVKKNSIESIYNLAQDFECRTALQELNAIPPVLDLLKSEYPIIQLLALKTLDVMTKRKKSQTMLRDNQGLDQLIKILETKDLDDLHIEALSVVANCLEDMDSMVLIQRTEALRKLLAFAESSTVPDIQKNAAKAIAKAAYYSENRKLSHEQEVERCLVSLLDLESDGTKIAASQVISAMCENTGSKEFFNTQGIPEMVHLLRSDNEEVREAAGLAVANLTTCSPVNAKKGRGKKEEEKMREEEEVLTIPKLAGEGGPEKEWYPPPDPGFCTYVYEVTKSILPMTNIKEQIEALAKYVAEKMGGKIPKDKIPDFSWELHISEPKFQLTSNVIPIGYIKKGIFYHQALLFKALADRIGVGCSLVRGEYGHAWNEVKLLDLSQKGVTGCLPAPDTYIVDLMFNLRELLEVGSKEANIYQFI
ncbi:armadillo repeat-containing protein 3-like [Octodon degus]|uniref:Armadillo repeat-containing protein 3-like n=1 Tax=Octodon degus TaxID=10160 RepID=A0A6P3FYB3_OCTDE|nr:armadillo repeat-containing protein 3-like [Octodon degus]